MILPLLSSMNFVVVVVENSTSCSFDVSMSIISNEKRTYLVPLVGIMLEAN